MKKKLSIHLLLLSLLFPSFVVVHALGAPSQSRDEAEASAVIKAIGTGSARERIRRISGGRAAWPEEAQAKEEFQVLLASREFAPVRRFSHREEGEEVARIRRVLAPLFQLHGGSTLVITVVNTPGPILGVARGSVFLISHDLLAALDDDELFSLAGHELAHQYFRRDFARAEDGHDSAMLRTIELKCDAISVLSAIILGRDPLALGRGLKWEVALAHDPAPNSLADNFPDLQARLRFIERLAEESQTDAPRVAIK